MTHFSTFINNTIKNILKIDTRVLPSWHESLWQVSASISHLSTCKYVFFFKETNKKNLKFLSFN